MIQGGEVGGVEHAVAGARQHRRCEQHDVAIRRAEDDSSNRKERNPRPEHALCTNPIDDEARECLADAGSDEERRGQRTRSRKVERKLAHQPGEHSDGSMRWKKWEVPWAKPINEITSTSVLARPAPPESFILAERSLSRETPRIKRSGAL